MINTSWICRIPHPFAWNFQSFGWPWPFQSHVTWYMMFSRIEKVNDNNRWGKCEHDSLEISEVLCILSICLDTNNTNIEDTCNFGDERL